MIAEMSSDIKIFKLNYSGSFDEILPEDLLGNLSLFNILTFYVPNQKKMYVWIGKRVSYNLKSHIPQIRTAISQEHPEFQILRNITIESGLEPPEFLKTIDIEESVLKSTIKELETKLLPVLSEINKLKSRADGNFISNNFEEAIKNAERIIILAKTINDDSLEQDQINFILESRSRADALKILQEIEALCREATLRFDLFVKDGDYQAAQNLVEDIKERYADKYNLSTIPLAHQLLLKNENMLYRLKIEQDTIIKEINNFIISFGKSSEKPNLAKMNNFREKIMKTSQNYHNSNINSKLQQVDEIYFRNKEALIRSVSQLSNSALINIEDGEVSKALDMFEQIVFKLDFENKYRKKE
ncbi:MAG: hypothetical protein ACFE96_11705 [Candidatus Hermodarchaeota archaeon]